MYDTCKYLHGYRLDIVKLLPKCQYLPTKLGFFKTHIKFVARLKSERERERDPITLTSRSYDDVYLLDLDRLN